MARINAKTSDYRTDKTERLAGGFGAPAARQDAEALLRRAVLANLLWEDVAYQDGESVAEQIVQLVPSVAPETVAGIAVEARVKQKLRHVPLLLVRECARHESHRYVVADALAEVIRRPDEMAEFLALYWKDGKQPLAASVKKGLARAFTRFDAYQLAKWNKDHRVKLRDVMFMVHPEPLGPTQASAFKALANRELASPDTWEVALSGGADKKETFERLIQANRLGALAFLRNLRGMEDARVDPAVIRQGFADLKAEWLLPLNFFAAAENAPRWLPEIEGAMFRFLAAVPRLRGKTILIVDVSGSMWTSLSTRSTFSRLDAAAAMAVLVREAAESVEIFATAGSDYARSHRTERLRAHRGFALANEVRAAGQRLGGGGIFTRQCFEYVREAVGSDVGDRVIVFSDSQDCESPWEKVVPQMFAPRNYVVDVSAHTRGVAYDGAWTAEVSGWSEHFIPFIAGLEDSLGSMSLQHA